VSLWNIIIILDIKNEDLSARVTKVVDSCLIPSSSVFSILEFKKLSANLIQQTEAASQYVRCLYLTDDFQTEFVNTVSPSSYLVFENMYLVDDCDKEVAIDNPKISSFSHVLAVQPENVATSSLRATLLKFRDNSFFGVGRFLGSNQQIRTLQLTDAFQRRDFRKDIFDYVKSLASVLEKPMDTYAQYAAEVQDELLMNAIWDANPRLSNANRTETPVLLANEVVEIEWGFDGELFCLGVRDHFGSFQADVIDRYLKYLFLSDKKGRVALREEGQGAGIGLYMVLDRVSQLSITVEAGKATEVVAIFNFAQSSRMTSRQMRSFQRFIL
jgi:hypothetical protein